MKKNIVPFFVAATFFISGCAKFLDTSPSDKYTQDNYWQTQERALAGLNGVYASLMGNGLYGGNTPLLFENFSPNTYHYSGDDNLIATGQHNANTGLFNSVWKSAYGGIGRANNLIANIDKVPMDAALIKRYKAEAKFLRAVYYFPLWNLFGGAPLILTATNDASQATLPRNTADELLTQILKDLDEAATDLPASYSGADKGRATKGAALALKARVLLFAGRYADAAAAAQQVINSKTYSVFPNYRALFYLENEGNQEVIFDVQFKYPEFTHGFDINLDQFNNIAPLPGLVNDYYAIDGKPIAQSALYNAAKPYENRDPRLLQTIIVKGSKFKGATVIEGQYPRTGFSQKKYSVYKDDAAPSAAIVDGQSELNYIVLRYADVLLMFAEAQNEAVGPSTAVFDALDAVRTRAGMPVYDRTLNKEQLRAEIRHERRIELAGEGLYYYDIRRWKTAETVMNTELYNDKNQRIDTRRFNATRDYLWPVPSQALQENTNLSQNAGYGK
ncbi:MAG TPA: RagB/SusD family nutrient uptake outer membrane protein [Phnomibacter sp.]|nr:RagB/SusD family nutrient uptake outer membrane protein [Phnomibacter sp.]